ncbi:malto-oligosyltrehalose synthase [Aphanothece hegewaldii CCALA 016]|uniref:Malto-oligosyltrehalose synthase n=1 Tax=Aphanothece hegewaldii CCALA 016 TaxID=2107694 RepID=A0A2T1LY74_9CHRO|nr:malto-oligosyltrehalose synthase [Aphanothece hegewaldii]PSF37348.1 malto-oligosyltrehalose synthase [Aphanothece hegewaldii CCALA 016]
MSDTRLKLPKATYRIQFRSGFTLRSAIDLIPYLSELGISHLYASPLLLAMFGSTHGYDVFDFEQLDPDLGTEEDLIELAKTLHKNHMGLVLDIVPNHMGIGGSQNRWWWDVLKNGKESKFAPYFDIDWKSPDPRLHGKILAPVLGDRYETVLAKGEIRLDYEEEELILRYHEHTFPINPNSIKIKEDTIYTINTEPEALDKLIQKQNYRLTFYQHGPTELNYRRFFNIITLAGVRVEDPNVFKEAHAPIIHWTEQGLIDGLRVDHPDGLRDPEQYLRRLHEVAPDAWIVVEKILEPGEELPVTWPVDGTTGYDFMNRAQGVLIDPDSEEILTKFYAEFTGEPTDYEAIVLEKKRFILQDMLCAEVGRLIDLLIPITARHWRYRDFARDELREALIELVSCFSVYRTYARANTHYITEADVAYIVEATKLAKKHRPDLGSEPFEFIASLLLLNLPGDLEHDFVMRFQQLTGPAMAKSVEDTAFYCYNRFVALNEVGGNPSHFGCSVEEFHKTSQQAFANWPNSMLGSSTHDTKRSEDVRSRLLLLSEIPEKWSETVQRWSKMNEKYRHQQFPDRNAEYLYYQTLVGAWPISFDRLYNYMDKAVCESKQYTSWAQRNPEYDDALREFIKNTFNDGEFIADLENFVQSLVIPGYINSLSQTLLKLTTPGIPDIYQGTELWDHSLVDPDNRRVVDFALRRSLLDELKTISIEDICRRYPEGLPKLWLIRQTLALRFLHPQIFDSNGFYEPLYPQGSQEKHVMAFSRGGSVVIVIPRLIMGLQTEFTQPESWKDTSISLPAGQWRNQLTDEVLADDVVSVSDLFKRFPMALLVREN